MAMVGKRHELCARNLGGFVPNKIFVGGVPITVTEDPLFLPFERTQRPDVFGRFAASMGMSW